MLSFNETSESDRAVELGLELSVLRPAAISDHESHASGGDRRDEVSRRGERDRQIVLTRVVRAAQDLQQRVQADLEPYLVVVVRLYAVVLEQGVLASVRHHPSYLSTHNL